METNKPKPDLSNPEAKKAGRELKALRIIANIDQQELADRCGLRKSTIIAIEMGKYNAGIRQLSQIADALGYEVKFVPKALPTDR